MKQEKIRIGVVGRAHGIRGAIRVFTDDPESDSLLRAKTVYLGEEQKAYRVLQATRCVRFIALQLEGVDDRDLAFSLTGQEVRICRAELRPLRGAYYACDLVGLQLRDELGQTWGTVTGVTSSGAQEILVYRRNAGGTGYVPFVAAHVGDVDLEGGFVQVESGWMQELDDVYGE